MRIGLFGLLSLLIVAATALSATAENPDALKIITVTETTFTPPELTIKTGDTVRWEWEAGVHVIVVSRNPAVSEDPDVLISFSINDGSREFGRAFDEAGTFYYYVQGRDDLMSGTITVLEATPVQRTTWGFIKSVFEAS